MLSDHLRAEVRRLFYAEHWKVGTIAGELGIHHDAVRRAIDSNAFASRGAVRPSALDPFMAFVRETLEKHPRLRATRLHQMLEDRGYQGTVGQLRRRLRQLGVRGNRKEAFLRLKTAPGEQGQVDWAHIGRVLVERCERDVYAFVMTLSWCRAIFVDFSFDMTAAAVARGHVRAFSFFGGVPRHCLYDNMKTVVVERFGDVIRFHPRIIELASHYHFAPRVCRPYRGNEKGRVERAIRYLRESFLAARSFTDIDDLRRQWASWSQDVALKRACPEDSSITVAQAWEAEREVLIPLPAEPLHASDTRPVLAHKQPYVRYDRNLYSVPHELVGKPLTLVATDTVVDVYEGETRRAHHARSWERDKVVEDPGHLGPLWAEKKAARHAKGRERLLGEVRNAQTLYQALVACGESMAPQTRALTLLLDRYGATALEEAIDKAVAKGTPRAHSIEQILTVSARQKRAQPPRPLRLPEGRPDVSELTIKNHNLEDYDDLAR